MELSEVDAVVLAGGESARMGEDKAVMEIGGRRLLDRALDAAGACRRVVIVGPSRGEVGRPDHRVAAWVEEEPPGSGPAHALAAGLDHVGAPWTFVLACDLPFVTGDVVARLATGAQRDGAVLTDGERDHHDCGIYPTDRLAAALAALGDTRGAPLWRALSSLAPARVADPVAAADLDTPDDAAAARRRFRS